jgi:hypothetical protein
MNCLQKAAKIREFARDSRSPEHAIFDSFGRVKDQLATRFITAFSANGASRFQKTLNN